jgi:hypothetical protein
MVEEIEDEVQALLEEGASLYEAGKLYEALAAWKEALRLDPGNEIATEYLRFIEDTFGIGVDVFLSNQAEPVEPPPPPPASPAPARKPDESMEELDWSEILDEGPSQAPSPAVDAPADEEFFVALEPAAASSAPFEAWDVTDSPAGPPPVAEAPVPAADPFTMPASRFADAVGGVGDPRPNDALAVESLVAPILPSPTLALDPFGTAAAVVDTWDTDDRQMSEDSIEQMLEKDFEAWEEATGRRRVSLPTDPFAIAQDLPSADPDRQPPVVAPPLEDEWMGLPPPLSAPWPARVVPEPPGRQATKPFAGRDFENSDVVEIPEEIERPSPVPAAHRTADLAVEGFPAPSPFGDLFDDAFADEAPELGALLDEDLDGGDEATTDFVPDLDAPAAFESLQMEEVVRAERSRPPMRHHTTPPVPPRAAPELPRARPEGSPPLARPLLDPLAELMMDPMQPTESLLDVLDELDSSPPRLEPPRSARRAEPAPPPPPSDDLDWSLEPHEPPARPATPPARPVTPPVQAQVPVQAQPPVQVQPPTTPEPVAQPAAPRLTPEAPAVEDPTPGVGFMRRTRRRSDAVAAPVREERAPAREERAPAPAAPAGARAPINASLESLLRSGLSDLDKIESRAGAPVRQLVPAPLPAGSNLDDLMDQASRKQRAGDFSGSLEIVERVLTADPGHGRARAYLEANTTRLLEMYRARLGPLTRMPRVKLRPNEIIWQSLDHRAGFLISQVDGRTTFEDIIEISGMSELDATRMLARLVEFGIIG